MVVDGITPLTHLGSDDDAYPAALGAGKLTVRHGCIAMDGSRGPAVFILWPPGYGLRTRGETVEVTDADGDLVAAPGDPITLGGGFGDLAWADEVTGGRIPNECRDGAVERYFLAAPDAWPFAENDGVTLLPTTETVSPEIPLCSKEPLLSSRDASPSRTDPGCSGRSTTA